MGKAGASQRDCPHCLCSTTHAFHTDLPSPSFSSSSLLQLLLLWLLTFIIMIIITTIITTVVTITTFMTFFSKVSCSASAPCSKTVHPRGRGQPLKNMSVRGPVPPAYLDEPPEPCELPLLLNRRRGMDGVLGPLSVCRSWAAVEAVASILAVLSC